MSKLRNTGIVNKQGFWYTCYIATATQNLDDFRNSSVFFSAVQGNTAQV